MIHGVKLRRVTGLDWEAIAGVIAAVVALVLHLLHIADEGVLLAIALVILALLLLRDVRAEGRADSIAETVRATAGTVSAIQAGLAVPDAILIGPVHLRIAAESFAQRARGNMIWFNVCLLMFRPQSLFDSLLRPAIENPRVTGIQFVLDESERERWAADVLPKVMQCAGAAKVQEPRWCALDESVSFILTDTEVGKTEAHVSFWGEPFMARTPGRNVPRYVFHVQPHSELLPRLAELERGYRLGGG
jgi:hypothetical protein